MSTRTPDTRTDANGHRLIACCACGCTIVRHPDESPTDPKRCARCWRAWVDAGAPGTPEPLVGPIAVSRTRWWGRADADTRERALYMVAALHPELTEAQRDAVALDVAGMMAEDSMGATDALMLLRSRVSPADMWSDADTLLAGARYRTRR